MEVTATPRITYDFRVVIEGFTFNAVDMLEVLNEMDGGRIEITNDAMVKVLMAKGVINSGGNKRLYAGAEIGPNFESFREELIAAIQKARESIPKVG